MEEKKAKYYDFGKSSEPLILEKNDWTEDEWKTICRIFSMESADRIKVSDYNTEAYGAPKSNNQDSESSKLHMNIREVVSSILLVIPINVTRSIDQESRFGLGLYDELMVDIENYFYSLLCNLPKDAVVEPIKQKIFIDSGFHKPFARSIKISKDDRSIEFGAITATKYSDINKTVLKELGAWISGIPYQTPIRNRIIFTKDNTDINKKLVEMSVRELRNFLLYGKEIENTILDVQAIID